MNENLINDFLERSNNVKDIDEDAIKDSTVQILIPSSGVAKVDMSSLWTYDNATRQDIVNEYFTNVNIINHMILDLCNGPVENKNEVVANIMEAITDHAEQLELHTNWPNLSPDAEAIMICLDVKAFLEACIQFIADTFDIIPEKENIIMDPELRILSMREKHLMNLQQSTTTSCRKFLIRIQSKDYLQLQQSIQLKTRNPMMKLTLMNTSLTC